MDVSVMSADNMDPCVMSADNMDPCVMPVFTGNIDVSAI
jgi:hypothetical protein